MDNLKITVYQGYLFWENTDKNLQNITLRLSNIREKTNLIILPEMFNTGFSMNAEALGETMNGKTMQWMQKTAQKFDAVVTGSIIIKEDDKFYNRLLWVRPDGTYEHYDKRHLFAMGKEHTVYTPGTKKLVVELNGWKICPAICYDLRFPVWLRNVDEDYDLLMIVANWPEKRALHWRTLIPARAVENQAYVIGVNRVGHDGNEIYHSGDSTCIDPNGNVVYYKRDEEDVYTFSIIGDEVKKARRALPFLRDADKFRIEE
ncbi:amidohydrolase [Mucilaginibacter phyllosphaerae]|uniref:Omega-amidase YafV n=1 Tax=Mucilaginibacter phyllosphaerae TaxID=1812349 RepID=A0A4Y8A8X1_9SPHI|nr:amidohydrolase [Mucilaginibacter phyllosphaerae]MBB3970841.1 putative amidohydrolase [Mucilaginibacter phyllosphaerae]TEW64223.1 amidohydrolase [Mucilaginibacter phyllosphaerae]GGH04930.1 hydrolase [Mucilaginibacter phyllosphaerae]